MKRVRLSQLAEVLARHPGAAIVTMIVRTEPRLLAKSRTDKRPVGEVYPLGIEKLCLGRFMVKNDYERNVRSQRAREGHRRPNAFTRDKLWQGAGTRVNGVFARHKESGRLYVVARPQTDEWGEPVRIWERWIDLATGRDLDGPEREELVREWLRDRPGTGAKQQCARPVPYRTYHVVSIHSLTIGGETFSIEPDQPAYTLT